jgi:hypothetical protein
MPVDSFTIVLYDVVCGDINTPKMRRFVFSKSEG